MYIDRTTKHSKDFVAVILPPISDNEQADTNLEPQFIKKRAGNISTLYLDSQKPYFQLQPNNIQMSSVTSLNSQPQNLVKDINRLAISKFEMFWQPTNVNPYNNTYTWKLFNGLTTYTFTNTITPANYTLTTLINLIIGQMTADANSIPLLGGFSATFHTDGFTTTITNNIPLTTFLFDLNSPLVQYGAPLLGIPITSTFASSLLIGPSRMLYSRYVDVFSNDLTAFSKNPNRSINKIGQDVVLRQYLTSPNANWTYSTDITHLSWMNWAFISPLSNIQFQLYDEFGNLFYFRPPQITTVSTPTLNWTLEILLEA